MNVKSSVGDTQAIMAECDRREAEVCQRLTAARNGDLPPGIKEALGRILRRTGLSVPDPPN
jgi:hypothetical protein